MEDRERRPDEGPAPADEYVPPVAEDVETTYEPAEVVAGAAVTNSNPPPS